MRKQEQRLWDRMRQGLKDKIYLERMENVVRPGRPDIDAVWQGITLPIELKAIENYPKRLNTPVFGGGKGLNLNQLNWWLTWRRWGGSGFILLCVGYDLYAVPAKFSDEVNGFTKQQLAPFTTNWVDLITEIRKETTCLRNR